MVTKISTMAILNMAEKRTIFDCDVWTVYYRLTKEAAIPGWSDTESSIGRIFESSVYIEEDGQILDFQYPYARQSNGGWMMCGRCVSDFSKVDLYPSLTGLLRSEG